MTHTAINIAVGIGIAWGVIGAVVMAGVTHEYSRELSFFKLFLLMLFGGPLCWVAAICIAPCWLLLVILNE